MPGRQQAGAHGGSRSRASERRNQHPRLARFQPARRHVSRKGWRTLRCSQPPYLATDRRPGAPPAAMKGLLGGSLFTGALHLVRKQVEACAIRTARFAGRWSREGPPIACEDSRVTRVRPDHVLCCITPAMTERSASSVGSPQSRAIGDAPRESARLARAGATQRVKASRAGVAPYRSRDAR